MNGGGKFALGIAILFAAMVLFFFAFHPGGVAGPNGANVSNPSQMLQFLMSEFQKGAGVSQTTEATLTASETGAANYPGYTDMQDQSSTNPEAVV